MANFEGFKETFQVIAPTIKELAMSYAKKEKGVDNLTWVTNEILNRTTGLAPESAKQTGSDILSAINNFSESLTSIQNGGASGMTREAWLAHYLTEHSGGDLQKAGDYLWQAHDALRAGNQAMMGAMKSPNPVNIADIIRQAEQNIGAPAEQITWNQRNYKALAEQIARQSSLIGMNGIIADPVPTGINVGLNAGKNEQILLAQDITKMESGGSVDQGIKALLASALNFGISKGKIPFIPKNTPLSTITDIACFGVEAIKSIGKLASGKINTRQAINHMQNSSVSLIAGLCSAGIAKGVGFAPFAAIPVVGPVMGFAAGSFIGKLTTPVIETVVNKGLSLIRPVAKANADSIIQTMATNATKVVAGAFKTVSKLFS